MASRMSTRRFTQPMSTEADNNVQLSCGDDAGRKRVSSESSTSKPRSEAAEWEVYPPRLRHVSFKSHAERAWKQGSSFLWQRRLKTR